MTIKDIKPGKVYLSTYNNKVWYIRVNTADVSQNYIYHDAYVENDKLYTGRGSWGSFEMFKTGLRELTEFEQEWFDSIVNSKAYLPLVAFVSNKELYPIF
jgi:hypothetical protein